jgi:ribonuclease HII
LEEPFWNQGRQWVAGVDEAGRGPLAGPVVAAAVIPNPALDFSFVRDSKKMRPEERERAYWLILGRSHAVGLGWATAGEIDRINILKASLLAMARAVQTLAPAAQVLLVDGPFPTPLDLVQKPIKKGDDLSRSIGAASIVAKVTRDRIMTALDRLYPGYGLARHKGYGTRDHMDVLARLGPTPIHRLTFKGVVP